jgi:hypothetical protein
MNDADALVVLDLDFENFAKISFLTFQMPKSGACKPSVLIPTLSFSSYLVLRCSKTHVDTTKQGILIKTK